MAATKFVSSGILLFLDQMVFAGGNWFYWIVVSFLSTLSDIGQTTTVYNLVILASTLTQLGFEYPLLKRASIPDVRIFGTTLLIVLLTTMPAIPILVFLLNNVYEGSFQRFSLVAIASLIFIALAFVSHFLLLGVSAVKELLIIDTIGTGLKFVVGYVLTINGYGALGLLLSFLLQAIFVAIVCLILSIRRLGFRIGKIKYIKEVVREAISNLPSKLSWLILLNLSTVLLGVFSVPSPEIGIFYMALNVSFAVGSFVLSMAMMAIPHSSAAKRDLSSLSIRVGLSFTSPLIGALIVSPRYILSLLGAQYVPGDTTLLVLAVSIFPFSIMINGISKFNYSGQLQKLLLIGSIQVSCFIGAFLLLTPQYGIVGAALSVLIAYIASSVPVLCWSDDVLRIYIAKSGLAIFVGSAVGISLGLFGFYHLTEIIAILASISIISIMNIVFKNISPAEIKQLIRVTTRR
jgi:O-antigen/teichoic acid export membrane protein